MSDRRGFHLALLGIDGIGKTTLTGQLAALAEAQGQPVRLVSWRSYLENPPNPEGPEGDEYPRRQLEDLWVQSFGSYFGGATLPDGSPVRLPDSYQELNEWGGTEFLNGVVMRNLRGSGPLASAWTELAANTILHTAVIGPLVRDGFLVLQESYGYKHLVKLFAYAAHLSPEVAEAAAAGLDLATEYFGHILRPDLGIYLHGRPELALGWRRAEGQLGTFESFANAGREAEESFVVLQRESAACFDAFAAEQKWIQVEVTSDSKESNFARVLAALSGTPISDMLGGPG